MRWSRDRSPSTGSSARGPSGPTASTRSRPRPVRRRHAGLPGMLHGQDQAQPARARADQAHRCIEGARAPGREGRRHAQPTSPEAEDKVVTDMGEGSPTCASCRTTCSPATRCSTAATPSRQSPPRRPHTALRGARPDRRRVRAAAARSRRARCDASPMLRSCTRPSDPRAPSRPSEPPRTSPRHNRFDFGDIEQGLRAGDAVVEREFTTKMVHQGYIEPHASTAFWNTDGQITIWTSTQGSFAIRAQVCRSPGLPHLEDQGDPDGDRRRLRREDPSSTSSPSPRCSQPQDRQAREDSDGPHGRLRGHRPDVRRLDQGEDGRNEGRQARAPRRPNWHTRPAPSPGSRRRRRRHDACSPRTTSRTSSSTPTTSS